MNKDRLIHSHYEDKAEKHRHSKRTKPKVKYTEHYCTPSSKSWMAILLLLFYSKTIRSRIYCVSMGNNVLVTTFRVPPIQYICILYDKVELVCNGLHSE